MERIDSKSVYQIFQKYYPELLGEIMESFHIEKFEQGFMNNVLHICIKSALGNSEYVLILYNANRYNNAKSIANLEYINQICEYVLSKGLPVRTAIKNTQGNRISRIEDSNGLCRYVGVYQYLIGETISWEAYTRRHLRSLGLNLAKLHSALKEIGDIDEVVPRWRDYVINDMEKLVNYLSENKKHIKSKLALEIDFENIKKLVESLVAFDCPYHDPDYNSQLIHCDFVRGNILFSKEKTDLVYKVTGILDFEKMLVGSTEVDVARTLAFLFVDCKYKTREEVLKYFLQEGYNVMGNPNTKIIFSNLEKYMIYFWLKDFWKFLQCNPYESLFANEHYMRTIQELRKVFILF